ncbi:MAG: TolC family protein [Verrucomicrobiota bacterium]
MLRVPRIGLTLPLAALLSGCVPTSLLKEKPDLSIPAEWGSGGSTSVSETGWVDGFSPSKELEAIVAQAFEFSHDLKAAAARMKAAKARSIVERAPLFPQFSTSFQPSRTQRGSTINNANVQSGGSAADRNTLAAQSASSTDIRNNFDLAADVSWEIDLWGDLRNDRRASVADAEAARFDYYAARLSLAANAARTWFNAIEADQQMRLARETLKSFEDNLGVVEQMFERGIEGEGQGDGALDVRLTRANVASARGRLREEERNRDTAVRNLEVLLGQYPAEKLSVVPDLPGVASSVPAGIPSELLLRRPDIRAAEHRLFATGERVESARKAFLPSIRLTGSRGFQSEDLDDLLRPESIVWNIAGNLMQPLFQGARLAGELKVADANREEAVHDYAQTALTAFREVESALAADGFLAAQEAAVREAAIESKEAEKLAVNQYTRGLVDIVTVLESQRRSFDSASSLITISNLRLQNRVDLYLALGGDFSSKLKPEEHPVAIASKAKMTTAARRDKRWAGGRR